MHDDVIDTIVADMKASEPDHIAVTGDLVNLALDGEIEMARQWLESLGTPDDVSVVPEITTPMCPAPSTRSAAPGRPG